MTLPLVEATRAGARTARRFRYDSLFSAPRDLGMLLVPILATGFAFAMALRLGEGVAGSARAVSVWVSAFLLGNTSHVLLSFLMVGARRDMLHATERQAKTVILGALLVFVVSLFVVRVTWNEPTTHILFNVVVAIFAIHHTTSQAKGFWALYTLRGAQAGLPPPSAGERELQKVFVPLALLFVSIKWTLVGELSWPTAATPYLNVNPGFPAILPFGVTYLLIAAWLVYVAILFRALFAYGALNAAKLTYLGVQCAVITLQLVSPSWGVTIAAGIHGLEYYLLTRKMLGPTRGEALSKLTSALCWPAMLAVMSPILVVGALGNPWHPVDLLSKPAQDWALMLITSTVLAHYYSDAVLYRFRIPGIRKVALARLGFS
jgi:hypothetical protein